MDLQKNSLEYAHLVFSVAPSDTSQVTASVDLVTWFPVTFDQDGTGKVLLRGPASSATTGLLVSKTSQLWIQAVEDPEVVIRSAGMIQVY